MENKLSQNSVQQVKIGKEVNQFFRLLEKNNALTKNEIIKLSSPDYCKRTFNIDFPVLITEDKPQKVNGYRRYYSASFSFEKTTYFLTNHWFHRHLASFKVWQRGVLPIV